MEKLKCVAIDDEPLALALIKNYIEATEGLQLLQVFEDAIAAIEYLSKYPVDLLFLDVNMPDITGLELYNSLAVKPMVIFTTAYKNFAFEGFELNAIDYLLKPIDYIRFKKAARKAIDFHQHKQQKEQDPSDHLFVYSEYKLIKIEVKAILYLESLEDYVKIHLSNGKMIMTLATLKKVIDKLPADKFRRIHRSYVVAIKQVQSVANRKAQLSNDTLLPISDSYVSFIEEWKSN
ncbi:LytR/AlgR family response regulator transcription factor [Pedobacter xixiisoli]|uniref:Two component transcriptional regulator, LytTR family n=1 Tax=Pedobacter xixiisoli TaxID=1476464 RepID=A0A286A6D8_9SPHI|nr:LytTR family DNA-binding domain-containing protein [Pedobacter xixiisoli]SOD17474.1 two component transcriptional regulator, LytTR family [Pedobacter xixiisoli]